MAFCSQCGTTLPDDARFCPKCGAATAAETAPAQAAAAPRPASGPAPQPVVHPSARPGRGGLILPVVIIVALAVIAIAWWTQRDGARPIAGDNATERSQRTETAAASGGRADARPAETEAAPAEADATTTTAASLDSAFNADPDGARARYDGPVTVSGRIATMVTPGPTPALSLEGRTRFNYVVVNFPAGTRGQLAELAKGDRITVSCRSVTALAGTTMLQGCALD